MTDTERADQPTVRELGRIVAAGMAERGDAFADACAAARTDWRDRSGFLDEMTGSLDQTFDIVRVWVLTEVEAPGTEDVPGWIAEFGATGRAFRDAVDALRGRLARIAAGRPWRWSRGSRRSSRRRPPRRSTRCSAAPS